ncbi:MAG: 1-deoxy-D-xylulose-5-phosphate reductoisomerase [Desulfobacterales bacterium]|nr:1-deoxy-D-xylulose-5-phosphate reductoisomerase [Desulfobacterales bacterium]
MKKLAILGSTGSIGVNTLDIIERFRDKYEIVALSAGSNIQLLKEQITKFKPKVVSVLNKPLAKRLKEELAPLDIEILYGIEGTNNKETLVMAGKIVMKEAKENGVTIFPIDSEHSAIFQSLLGHQKKDVKRIILTASGGPFLNCSQEELANVTIQEALNHPIWEMGKKITIDSASLMNKGLEVIEARWLFDIPHEKIDVHIHPQSIVHSMVEYIDGSVVAQMGLPDMRGPISYALAYPERLPTELPSLNLLEIDKLTFDLPDEKRFPALRLAYRAVEEGGTMPAVLNAANEIAVEAFLNNKIGFTGIPNIIEQTMNSYKVKEINTIQDALEADSWARMKAKVLV